MHQTMLANYWNKCGCKWGLWLDYRRREFRALAATARRTQAEDGRPVISMSQLGRQGRFGNWLFQYMFLKCYALKHNLQVQTPHWPGHELFGCDDRLITATLPAYHGDTGQDAPATPLLQRPETIASVDFVGYFQYPTRVYAPYRDFIRRLFTPQPGLAAKLEQGVRHVVPEGRTLVGLHIRRGDFGEDQFYITPTAWYLELLEQLWPTLDNPILYIASDEPGKIVPDFADYRPRTARDLRVRLPHAPYFLDFYVLTQAHVLAIPNSTFSFFAALLNRNQQEVYRSHLCEPLESPPFRQVDPWNSDVLDHHACVEMFPNVAGIRRAESK